jgi:hypothetical protein
VLAYVSGGDLVRRITRLLPDHSSARAERTPPPDTTTLSFLSHRGSERNSDQQPFWSDETADSLAPRFPFILYEHSMTLRFKLPSCLFDIVNVKLKPSLRCRNFVRPGILAKAGLRYLRKGPQRESFCAPQSLGMKITAILFFEANTKGLVI